MADMASPSIPLSNLARRENRNVGLVGRGSRYVPIMAVVRAISALAATPLALSPLQRLATLSAIRAYLPVAPRCARVLRDR